MHTNLAQVSASASQCWQLEKTKANFLLVSCWGLLQGDTKGIALISLFFFFLSCLLGPELHFKILGTSA